MLCLDVQEKIWKSYFCNIVLKEFIENSYKIENIYGNDICNILVVSNIKKDIRLFLFYNDLSFAKEYDLFNNVKYSKMKRIIYPNTSKQNNSESVLDCFNFLDFQ